MSRAHQLQPTLLNAPNEPDEDDTAIYWEERRSALRRREANPAHAQGPSDDDDNTLQRSNDESEGPADNESDHSWSWGPDRPGESTDDEWWLHHVTLPGCLRHNAGD